jgi:hypothetical protein
MSPMTWDPDDKERTALHEAGHAVVAWSFNVVVGCIHLDPVGADQGRRREGGASRYGALKEFVSARLDPTSRVLKSHLTHTWPPPRLI